MGRPGRESGIDRMLRADIGVERSIRLRVAYIATAAQVLANTNYVMSALNLAAIPLAERYELRALPHPLAAHLPNGRLRMTWHASVQKDPAHIWLRERLATAVEALTEID